MLANFFSGWFELDFYMPKYSLFHCLLFFFSTCVCFKTRIIYLILVKACPNTNAVQSASIPWGIILSMCRAVTNVVV